MSGYSYASIQDLETASRLSITNARSSSDILTLLSSEGYGEAELARGLALCDALAASVSNASISLGAQKQNTQTLNGSIKEARSMMSLFRVKALSCFPSASASQSYDALRLGVSLPSRSNEFISYAKSVINTALADSSILTTMAARGYDEAKLKTIFAKITEAEQFNMSQELAKGTRQTATVTLREAKAALLLWWTPFKRVCRHLLSSEQQASLQL